MECKYKFSLFLLLNNIMSVGISLNLNYSYCCASGSASNSRLHKVLLLKSFTFGNWPNLELLLEKMATDNKGAVSAKGLATHTHMDMHCRGGYCQMWWCLVTNT